MKQFVLFISACMVMTHTMAQSNLPIPEFTNTINQVDTIQKVLKNLEKKTAEFDLKIKGLGYGGSESYLSVSGNESSVALQSSQAVFIVKLPDTDIDPTSYVILYKFKSDKDKRRVKIASRKFMGQARNIDIPTVDLSFTKISAGCYLITSSQPLKNGSYGFVLNALTVFAFDIK